MFDTDEKEDRKTLPITAKQLAFAQKLAIKNGAVLPWEVQQSRATLSAWIERQSKAPALQDPRPTSKQVAFAERIAKLKRRSVPDECYRDRGLMSRWIDSNKS